MQADMQHTRRSVVSGLNEEVICIKVSHFISGNSTSRRPPLLVPVLAGYGYGVDSDVLYAYSLCIFAENPGYLCPEFNLWYMNR